MCDVDDSNEETEKKRSGAKQVGQFGVVNTIRVSVGIYENFIIIYLYFIMKTAKVELLKCVCVCACKVYGYA